MMWNLFASKAFNLNGCVTSATPGWAWDCGVFWSSTSYLPSWLQIGGKVEDQDTQRYITRSGLEFTGTVWESSVTKLLEEKLDALFAS